MEIDTFAPRLDRDTALRRTRNLSVVAYLRSLLGHDPAPADVSLLYYPDYIAATSATVRRLLGTTTLKFLAGIDGVTGRVGEIDVDLPDRCTATVDAARVIEPRIDREEAEAAWRDWLFTYVSRHHRALAMPDYSLDDLALVHTPYWLIDRGSLDASLAVSDLTGRTARLTEIDVLAAFYRADD